jgi:putative nucleotidyltransferase with HDIG domain
MKSLDVMTKVNAFPSMPGAAAKLLDLLDDPDTSLDQVEQVLRFDPSLTANILKLANSAYFGFPAKIGSIRQAVVLLGSKRLLQIVMTSCVGALMDKTVPGYDLPPGEILRHSLAVTVAAEGLVRELQIKEADEIFTAALLHDLGKLILGSFVKDDWGKIETEAAGGVSFEVAERTILGTDHAEVGAEILKNWSFPKGIIDAVRWHHNPENAEPKNSMIDVVHVANVLCLMIGIGVGIEGLHYKPSTEATKRLGIKPMTLEKIASQTLQWANELSDSLGSHEG